MRYDLNMGKKLIFIRHAHRDVTDRGLDNGLTDKGRTQAKALAKFFEGRFKKQLGDNDIWLLSSPKRRCLETLAGVSKICSREIDIHPGLGEHGPQESFEAYLKRIDAFLGEWRSSSPEITLACSHGDWIPAALKRTLQLDVEVKKGSWTELELCDSGEFRLRWMVQNFKFFT